jgi:hypothetical protein
MGRYDLRLSEEEFWELTPRKFHVLLKRRELDIQHTELLHGINASVSANFSMASPKTPTKPSDFMPSQWGKKVEPKKRVSRKQAANNIRCFLEGRKDRVY